MAVSVPGKGSELSFGLLLDDLLLLLKEEGWAVKLKLARLMTSFDFTFANVAGSMEGFAGVRARLGSMTELVTRGRALAGPRMIGVLEREVNAADESGGTNGSGCHSSTRSSTSCNRG